MDTVPIQVGLKDGLFERTRHDMGFFDVAELMGERALEPNKVDLDKGFFERSTIFARLCLVCGLWLDGCPNDETLPVGARVHVRTGQRVGLISGVWILLQHQQSGVVLHTAMGSLVYFLYFNCSLYYHQKNIEIFQCPQFSPLVLS